MLIQFPKLTKYFDIITDTNYIKKSSNMQDGDILIRDGHTATVLVEEDPTPIEPVKPESKDSSIAGTYKATTAVNMRYGPSSSQYDIIKVVQENEEVTCDGSYTDDWYYVTTKDNITGYIKKDYLKLVSKPEPVNPSPDPSNNNDDKSKTLAEPKSKNSALSGKYVATEDVNLRYGPSSKEYDIIRVVKKGEIVNNYGYYTNNWLYVKDYKSNKGYINKSYLKKK